MAIAIPVSGIIEFHNGLVSFCKDCHVTCTTKQECNFHHFKDYAIRKMSCP